MLFRSRVRVCFCPLLGFPAPPHVHTRALTHVHSHTRANTWPCRLWAGHCLPCSLLCPQRLACSRGSGCSLNLLRYGLSPTVCQPVPHARPLRRSSAFLELPAAREMDNKRPVSQPMGAEYCLRSSGAWCRGQGAGWAERSLTGSGKEPRSPGGAAPALRLPQTPPQPGPSPAVPTAGQARLPPRLSAAPMAAAAHPLLHAGLGGEPQHPPRPLEPPG